MQPLYDGDWWAARSQASQQPPTNSATAIPSDFGSLQTIQHKGISRSVQQAHSESLQLLTDGQEEALIQHVNDLSDRGLPPTPQFVRNLVFEIVKKQPGKNWVTTFCKRHRSRIKSLYLRAIDQTRHIADNSAYFEHFYATLKQKVEKYHIKPHNVYNFDEKGFLLGLCHSAKRIVGIQQLKSKKIIGASQDGSREFISLLACICADGTAIPLALIYQGTSGDLQDTWLEDFDHSSDHAYFAASEKGWTNEDLGMKWLEIFDRHTKDKAGNSRRLLLVDGHSSHVNLRFIDYCDRNRILLVVLPPHSTHRLQPLDVGIFSPLAHAYSQEIDQLIQSSCGFSRLTKRSFWRLFAAAWERSVTVSNIKSAFSGPGIVPLEPEKVLRSVKTKTPSPATSDNDSKRKKTPGSVRGVRRLAKEIHKEHVIHTANVEAIIRACGKLAIENEVLRHANSGLRTALVEEEKKRKRGKGMGLFDKDRPGEAQFFSPAKVAAVRQRAQEMEIASQLQKAIAEERKMQKAREREEKAQEKAEKAQERAARRQAKLAERELATVLCKKHDSDQFTIGFDLSAIPEAAQFVARENELAEMHRLLHGHKSRSAVVLHGLGGIGKTQLAIEYARRHKEKYTAVFWLNANDEDSLKSSFRNIAEHVVEEQKGKSSTSVLASIDLDGNLDQVVAAVKTWLNLRRNTRWLMIYDNYDNPRTPGNLDWHKLVRVVTSHVQKLPNIHEGLEILSNTSKRENIENDRDAIALVKKLDGLPLALSAAGAYLEHVTTSFSDYLRLYEASWLKLQMMSPQLSSYEDRSLCTTWQITFDRIKQQNAASAKLLELWAYFDRQDVWFELVRHTNSVDDEWIQKLTEDELNFNEAVGLLCSFGLVDIDRSVQQQFRSGGYNVHSCVHSWTVFVLNKEWDEGLARLALTCVVSEVPGTSEKNWWLIQRRLLQHVRRQDVLIVDGKVDINGLDWAFHNLGDLYADQGKLAEAEKMYIRALQGYEEALGPDHPSTLDTVNNLGSLYADQGKLAEAEKMYIRALQGYEHVLGPELVSSYIPALNTMSNYGDLFSQTDRKDMARTMYTRALSGYTAVHGASSDICKDLEGRLQTLQLATAETCDDASIDDKAREAEVTFAKNSTQGNNGPIESI
ncbi:hypothetical protein DV736_g5297, partial [Chaetothyriales sp. CBS 134916]